MVPIFWALKYTDRNQAYFGLYPGKENTWSCTALLSVHIIYIYIYSPKPFFNVHRLAFGAVYSSHELQVSAALVAVVLQSSVLGAILAKAIFTLGQEGLVISDPKVLRTHILRCSGPKT